MAGDPTNARVEPCRAIWNGIDIGLTEGDIDVKMAEKTVKVTAHQEGSNDLDEIRTGKSVGPVTLKLIETSPAQVKNAIINGGGGSSGGVAQAQTILCVADVAGSLNSKFFFIVSKSGVKYVVWLNVNAAGVAPVVPGYTAVQVTLATGATAIAVATAVAAALDALADFVAPNSGTATTTVTDANAGFVAAGLDAGNSGFTPLISVVGVSLLTGWGRNKDFFNLLADSHKLVLHPTQNADTDYTGDLAFWKAYPHLNSIKLSGEHLKTVDVSFSFFPDTTKPDGVRLMAYGDHT